MRVFVLNNYDLERVGGQIAAGEKPAHHLYGIDSLRQRGWKVIVAGRGPKWVNLIGRWLAAIRCPIPVGSLGQQWSVWRAARRGDIVFAPCQTETQLLSYLRAFEAWPVPIVTLAHHPASRGRAAWLRRPFYRWQLRGTDRFPALSRGVSQELRGAANAAGLDGAEFAPVVGWGPDLAYYRRWAADYPGSGVVGAGRTARDWVTFGTAATCTGVPARIICLTSDIRPAFASFGPNVQVSSNSTESGQSYSMLLPLMARARVLAVPLSSTTTLAGLTSLTDALGLGKPVIMTRHPLIDLDIEKEQIGRWVDPGDVDGWIQALRWFDAHPAEAAAMGRRALALAERALNSDVFGQQLERLLSQVSRWS